MLENIHLAFEGIWSHKLRSILTMLGIIIGIAAIITIVSTIKGTNEQIKENLIGAGNNVVTVQLNQNGNTYDLSWSPLPDTVRVISEETRQALEDINGAEEVSLYYSRSYTDGFFYLDTPFNGNVLGVDRYYFSTYGMQIRAGRGFTEKDYTEFRKVALVDSTAAKSLFSGADPVGKEIEFGSDVYTVVGVIGPAEEFTPTIKSLNDYYLYANNGSGSIYFPDSLWPALYQFDEPQSVAIKVKNTDVMASVGKKAADLLTGSQIIGTDTGFDYRSADMLEQAQQLLEEYPEQTAKLSTAAKAKRVNDRSNPAYRWVALAIIVAGIAAVVYGIMALIRGENVGVYFALFGLAAIFFFSGAHVLPTAKNNKKAIAQEWERSISDVAALLPEDFPVPARYAHPVVLQRMIRVLREGRAQSVEEALNVMKKDLKALNASVQVEQEEYDEVVVIKPLFLVSDYQ